MIVDARVVAARVTRGSERAKISTASAVRKATSGAWRRQPGRCGATEDASAGDTNAASLAAIARRRPRVPDDERWDREKRDQRQGRAEAHGAALARLPSVTRREIGCPKRSSANSADEPGCSEPITAVAACAPLIARPLIAVITSPSWIPLSSAGRAGHDELDHCAGLPERVSELDAEVRLVRAGCRARRRCVDPDDRAGTGGGRDQRDEREPDAQVAGAPKLRASAHARSPRRVRRRRAAAAPAIVTAPARRRARLPPPAQARGRARGRPGPGAPPFARAQPRTARSSHRSIDVWVPSFLTHCTDRLWIV